MDSKDRNLNHFPVHQKEKRILLVFNVIKPTFVSKLSAPYRGAWIIHYNKTILYLQNSKVNHHAPYKYTS